MGNPLKRSKEGATLLQEADVSGIVSSLAIGIAEAQVELDTNSVKQTLLLADPDTANVNGKSLIQLGFTPAFYHFQYADVSASISLRMKEVQEDELNIDIDAEYKKQGGYNADRLDYLKETENANYKKGYKSSREFVMNASETRSLKVQSETVEMNQQEGAISKVESFQDRLQSVQNVERARSEIKAKELAVVDINATTLGVTVQNHAGYISISLPQVSAANEGILKVSNYNGASIDLNGAASGADFALQADFGSTLALARSTNTGGTVVGLNKTTINMGGSSQTMPLTINFDYNVDKVEPTYHNNATMMPFIDQLVKVLKADETAKIQVSGYTDGSGGSTYNTDLSMRRAKNTIQYLTGLGVPPAQFLTPNALGESLATNSNKDVTLRKVTIELTTDGDYFLFNDGLISEDATPDETATADASVVNGFMYLKDGYGNTAPSYTIKFAAGSETFNMTVTDLSGVMAHVSNTQSISEKYSAELVRDTVYLLHNESMIKWTLFNKNTEEIEMEVVESNSQTTTQAQESYLLYETSNASTRLKKESEKFENPSSFAVGASVDFRMARQFEMNVEGNASVSARLVSLPAPPEFLDEIKAFFS